MVSGEQPRAVLLDHFMVRVPLLGTNHQTVPYGNDAFFHEFQALKCQATIIQSLRDANFSATRSACAAIVNAGLQAAEEGKNELSTTNRLLTSWERQNGSSTEL